jgi:hypothetical protein
LQGRCELGPTTLMSGPAERPLQKPDVLNSKTLEVRKPRYILNSVVLSLGSTRNLEFSSSQASGI